MQVTFPERQGYAGMFVVGHRERGGEVQRTGTVVLKRTYLIDRTAGTLAPSPAPLPVFRRDQPYNLAFNGDFEAPQATAPDLTKADGWTPAGGNFAREAGAGVDTSVMAVKVSGAGATLTQTVAFDQPLGGRQFTLSVSARADTVNPFVNAQVQQVCLEEPGGAQICVLNATLTDTMARLSSVGTWPASVTAKEARIVLRAPTDPVRFAYYDRVQLEERGTRTKWDPQTELYLENDLATYKPEADLIVLGLTDAAGVSRASVDGVTWLQRTVTAPPNELDKALFGWQSRVVNPRRQESGTFVPLPPKPLPADFDNAFFNGYQRGAAQLAARPFAVPDATAEIRVVRPGNPDYVFRLPGDTAAAGLAIHAGEGPDDSPHWRRRPVPMSLDTIVVEPEADRCYLVWRGGWPFDEVAEDAYRELAVTASP